MFDLRQTVPNRWADVTKYFPSNLLFHDQLLHGLTEVQVNAKRMGLVVTCPQQFWQSDWDILCATVVTWLHGDGMHTDTSQYKMMEGNYLLFLLGIQPVTF